MDVQPGGRGFPWSGSPFMGFKRSSRPPAPILQLAVILPWIGEAYHCVPENDNNINVFYITNSEGWMGGGGRIIYDYIADMMVVDTVLKQWF